MRRLMLSIVLVAAGLVGGLVISGWVRAEVFRAPEPPPPALGSAPDQRAASIAQPSAPLAYAGGGGPDFTRVAGQTVKGGANISSLPGVRPANSPVCNH